MKQLLIAVMGWGGVGKTALTIQFCYHHFVQEYDPGIEDEYVNEVTVDERICRLEILDTAGQEEYCALKDYYMRRSNGFIVVYSITSHESFERTMEFIEQMERVRDVDRHLIKLTLCGNKVDLCAERQVTTEEGASLAESLGCPFFETSAKTRINVDEAFIAVTRRCLYDSSNENENPPEGSSPEEKEKKCIIC